MACSQDLDYLIIISGPEPQRSILEKIILARIGELDGSGVVLLGSPQGSKTPARRGDWICIPYVPTEIKAELMNRAKCVICRSGYTTLMELAELGKTQALLIPTPGQTEQEYLSWYYRAERLVLFRRPGQAGSRRRCGQDKEIRRVPGDARDRG